MSYSDEESSCGSNDSSSYGSDFYKDDTENSGSDNYQTVVSKISILLEKRGEEKTIPFFIRYDDENSVFDAETSEYENEKINIKTLLSWRYPGWNIKNIQTHGYSKDSSYFDLDATTYD